MSIPIDGGLDVAGGFGSGELLSFSADTFGAQVVTKTLDYMNDDPMGGHNSDYDFQKSVLSAVYTGSGTILDDLG
ncbi:hypothetical protein [Desulfocurvus sp. DL9XJH121]